MTTNFRRRVTSWIILGFLGLAVIAMVVTGFDTGLGGQGAAGGGSGETIATVGDERITDTEFTAALNRQLRQARQQQPELDLAQFVASGAFDQILDQMVMGKALMAFAREQGVAVSETMIDREILNIPAFRNFANQFDENAFRQALARQEMTERELRDDIRQMLVTRQLLMPISLAAQVPDMLARQYASLLLERRRGLIGVVPSEAMGAGVEPTPAEIQAFYRENRVRYTVPERRVLRFAVVGREQVAAAARPSEQEIAAFYAQNAATYGPRESRNLLHVVLPDEAAARSFMQRIRGGASFAQAAAQADFSAADIRLDGQSREQFANVSSAQVSNAVFAAAQGAMVGPVRSELGWHVVRVEAINRTAARPLASARTEIARQLEARKLQDALANAVNRIEERAAQGASFEEIVRAERLTAVETPAITATGSAPGASWQPPQELAALIRPAFEMEAGGEPEVQQITANERYALLSVPRAIPAAVPPLAQIAQQVKADLVRRRASERARAVAASIVAKINGGVPTRQAFAEAGVRLPTPQPVEARRLDIAQANQQVPPPLQMLFSLPERRARQLLAPNGAGWFVVVHEQRTPGSADADPRLVQATRAQFAGVIGEEYAEQLARAALARNPAQRSDEAIRRLRQRLLGNAAQ